MAVQQNRKTPSKRGMRRSHDKLKGTALSVDPTSGETHLRHRIGKSFDEQAHRLRFLEPRKRPDAGGADDRVSILLDTFAPAAGVLIPSITASFSLQHLGRLSADDHVLVQAAAHRVSAPLFLLQQVPASKEANQNNENNKCVHRTGLAGIL